MEDVTYNICDQRFLEFEIRHQNPSVIVIRRTLTQIANTAKLSEKQELIMYVAYLIMSVINLSHLAHSSVIVIFNNMKERQRFY